MYHVFYFDGNEEEILRTIQTSNSIIKQNRKHVKIYKNKVTDLQSKYIALHVGLFWAIGTFNIKKGDHVKIILDEQNMFEHFPTNNKRKDPIVEKRKQHINQIIIQRKLDISYENNCRQKIKTANEVKTNTARLSGDISDAINNNHT